MKSSSKIKMTSYKACLKNKWIMNKNNINMNPN